MDYVNAHGDATSYVPDFLVKKSLGEIYIVETKGREGLSLPMQMERLRVWCEDVNKVQGGAKYDFVYVPQDGFYNYKPKSFAELVANFRGYRIDNAGVA